jgi:hypothetical protein
VIDHGPLLFQLALRWRGFSISFVRLQAAN